LDQNQQYLKTLGAQRNQFGPASQRSALGVHPKFPEAIEATDGAGHTSTLRKLENS
jgi:hypothetical protein